MDSRSNIVYKPTNSRVANKESLRRVTSDFARQRNRTHPKEIAPN